MIGTPKNSVVYAVEIITLDGSSRFIAALYRSADAAVKRAREINANPAVKRLLESTATVRNMEIIEG